MSERGLQISQTVALFTAIPAAAAFLLLLFLLDHGQPEIVYGLMFIIIWVTGFCAAVAYAVSLIWLFVYWIRNDSVGNRPLTIAAVFLPAAFFIAAAVTFH